MSDLRIDTERGEETLVCAYCHQPLDPYAERDCWVVNEGVAHHACFVEHAELENQRFGAHGAYDGE